MVVIINYVVITPGWQLCCPSHDTWLLSPAFVTWFLHGCRGGVSLALNSWAGCHVVVWSGHASVQETRMTSAPSSDSRQAWQLL